MTFSFKPNKNDFQNFFNERKRIHKQFFNKEVNSSFLNNDKDQGM